VQVEFLLEMHKKERRKGEVHIRGGMQGRRHEDSGGELSFLLTDFWRHTRSGHAKTCPLGPQFRRGVTQREEGGGVDWFSWEKKNTTSPQLQFLIDHARRRNPHDMANSRLKSSYPVDSSCLEETKRHKPKPTLL